MIAEESSHEDEQLSLLGRLTGSLVNRRFGFFFAELVLVIAGVLIALAVDGWISDMRDGQLRPSTADQKSRTHLSSP